MYKSDFRVKIIMDLIIALSKLGLFALEGPCLKISPISMPPAFVPSINASAPPETNQRLAVHNLRYRADGREYRCRSIYLIPIFIHTQIPLPPPLNLPSLLQSSGLLNPLARLAPQLAISPPR
jgi:hypothetical protein